MPRNAVINLEDAIKSAKIAVEQSESPGQSIIIDRSKQGIYASRKRERLCTVTSDLDQKILSKDEPDTDTEVAYWKERCAELSRDKIENEKEADALLKLSTERETKLEAYAKLLERKIAILEKSAKIDGTGSNEYDTEDTKVRQFLELMTSMSVRVAPEKPSDFICTLKNVAKRTVTRFVVSLERALSPEAQLTGLSFEPKANADLLPDYLRVAISCEPDMGPVMMSDMLQSLFQDENDDEG